MAYRAAIYCRMGRDDPAGHPVPEEAGQAGRAKDFSCLDALMDAADRMAREDAFNHRFGGDQEDPERAAVQKSIQRKVSREMRKFRKEELDGRFGAPPDLPFE